MANDRHLTPATVEAELRKRATKLGITIPETEIISVPIVAKLVGKPLNWVYYQLSIGNLPGVNYAGTWEIQFRDLVQHRAKNTRLAGAPKP